MQIRSTIPNLHKLLDVFGYDDISFSEVNMLVKRTLSDYIDEAAKGFPVITISGPRQSGKTTFVKMKFPDYDYISLEDPDMREYVSSDPRDFIQRYGNRVIIDEFQRVPELASYLQRHIDEINEPAMYILTGSNQLEYLNTVSQSLAGRTVIFKLLPFSYNELYSGEIEYPDLYEIIVKGWYPRIFDKQLNYEEFYQSYFDTYIQRDIRNLLNIRDLNDFQRFVRLCAGRTGQIINFSNISNEIGVNYKTIKGWISILQASFIIDLVQPYHRNFNKRIVKSPKMYFLDTGLVCNLIGIHNAQQLRAHPLRGEIFETYAYSELLKLKNNTRISDQIYYYRDSHQNEIDFLMESGYGLIPIEVKLNSTPKKALLKNIEYFNQLTENVHKNFLIYSGSENLHRYNSEIIGYPNIQDIGDLISD